MPTVTISLPESLNAFVESQIAAKGFGDVSEYIRSLLREAQAREEEEEKRLEGLLLEGLASERIPLDDAFWKVLRAKASQIAEQHQNQQP